MNWRIKRNQMKLQQLNFAAREIQRCYRGYIARKVTEKMKAQRSAVKIQCVFRGHLKRIRHRELIKTLNAVEFIQRMWRGFRARINRKKEQRINDAATSIQRVWKGHKARKRINGIKNKKIVYKYNIIRML